MSFRDNIVYIDEHFMVINKPANLVMHHGIENTNSTLQDLITANFDQYKSLPRSGIINRLDKDTTGLIVASQSLEIFNDIKAQFEKKTAKRLYLALVHGCPSKNAGYYCSYLKHDHKNRKIQSSLFFKEGYVKAETYYHVIKRYKYYSLIEFQLLTGKTHQIRVHAQKLKMDIVGDQTYSSRKYSIIKRQLLHAHTLVLCVHGEEMCFNGTMPNDMQFIIDQLNHDNEFKLS